MVNAGEHHPEGELPRQDIMRFVAQQALAQVEAQKVNDVIYKATGFSNTFMVLTDEGNIIIDTSLKMMAGHHKKILSAVSDGPIHSVILTHAHKDHTGGVELWRQPQTRVIAQENMVEFVHYQHRLKGMFALRNAAQFNGDKLDSDRSVAVKQALAVENFGGTIFADTLFDKELNFTVGEEVFRLIHTPAETYDALTVWMPRHKAAFVGDLYYQSFPNIYTLRGTKPRWALDYVASLNKVLALEPEILLPSHGKPIKGRDNIRKALTRYRDAIQSVHDQTVAGMNQGKDVYTLMREVHLPEALQIGEAYGSVSWSVRGIYEGYMGWFDGKPLSMYPESPKAIVADLVKLAGGADKVVEWARPLIAQGNITQSNITQGKMVKALHLLDAALDAEPAHQAALALRLQALVALRKQSENSNESGWLNSGINQTRKKMQVQVSSH